MVREGHSCDDQREATGEVITRTAVEPHSRPVLPGDNAKTIVFDLVQPLAARGQLIGFGWKARRDERGREGTRRHDVNINRLRWPRQEGPGLHEVKWGKVNYGKAQNLR